MIEIKPNRTNSYRATVEMKNGNPYNDKGYVKKLREIVNENNGKDGRTFYVKLQGRGPRKHNGRRYDQALPLPYATTADVYVYERY